jgi:hypothetical protein
VFDYSTTGLLQSIRDLTYAGGSIRDWSDDMLIRLLNREVAAFLVPLMAAARRNHLATFTDQALVTGQAAYYLPSNAAGQKARAVQLVDASGNPFAPVKEADLEEVINWGATISNGTVAQGVPARYYWRGNQMVLYPVPGAGLPALSLRVYFLNRPSSLTPVANCVQSTSFGSSGGGSFTLNVASVPATLANGATVDLVQAIPGFDILGSFPLASQTLTSLTFTGTRPAQLAAGDWACPTTTAPVVTGGIPEIVVGALIEQIVLKVMNGKADNDTFNRQRSVVSDSKKSALQYLNRRNTGDRDTAGGGSLQRFRRGGLGTGVW